MSSLPAMKEPQTVGDLVDRLPPPVEAGSVALMRLIERAATSPDFDVAKLEKLLEVRERWEAGEARKAFVTALAAFKASPPTVIKNKHAGFESRRTGDKTDYDYATLDQVCGVIAPALSRHGLSHRWETAQADGRIRVTCILTHEMGHSEQVSLEAGADTSGSKNAIQAIGSALSYLQRYSLMAVTGLAAADQDDDGHTAFPHGDQQQGFLADDEVAEIKRLVEQTSTDLAKFLGYVCPGAQSIDEIPRSKFASAKAALHKKQAKQ